MNQSPLHNNHVNRGARMIGFGGWELPIQFTGSRAEHEAVRTAAGVFDISHMANLRVEGDGAADFLQGLLANDLSTLEDGLGHYTFLLNPEGGVIDDLYLFRIAANRFYLVLNAAVFDQAFGWIAQHCPSGGVTLADESRGTVGVALQGPESAAICEQAFPGLDLPTRNCIVPASFDGVHGQIARTGYTGEDGFELFFPKTVADALWDHLIAAGALPCGLAARDSLRLEAGLPLNGSDLRPDITPVQAGFARFAGLKKGVPFIGREALLREQAAGPARRLVLFKMPEKAPPPRPHYPICAGEDVLGEVTSGVVSPSLGLGIGFALLESSALDAGAALEIEIRKKRFPIQLTKRSELRKKKATS